MKRNWVLVAPLIGLALVAGGCRRGLSGTYKGDGEFLSLSANFEPRGKVYVTTLAGTFQSDYTVDGDKVIISNMGSGNQNMVLTLAPDGSLTGGPLGLVLHKKQ